MLEPMTLTWNFAAASASDVISSYQIILPTGLLLFRLLIE